MAGNGTDSNLQFGNLADMAIEYGEVDKDGKCIKRTNIYVADGDGGSANRVVKLSVPCGYVKNEDSW
jgi:hypothetical protein